MEKNQKEEIKRHLKDFGHITSMAAIKEYGITRLASKVHLLRNEGLNIETLKTDFINRYGRNASYATYKLIETLN